MRPIETSSRIRTIALLAAFAVAACGGGEPAEEGAEDSGIAAESEGNLDADRTPAVGDPATGDPAAGDPTTAPTGTAAPATVTVLQVQEVNEPGMLAELTEATRKNGVLTVKIRFRNTATDDVNHYFETRHGAYELFYVTAGTQKYFVLKDTEGEPLAPKYLDVSLDPGATSTWWAKFPAPPASETTIDLVIPDTPPFEDIPITDR
ncbi:MAG TPA: hypothetical protein VEY33_08985 [Gemmatimonadota bacterium]|nr:hypothetical protein [Gemmatimonadota bacterium]